MGVCIARPACKGFDPILSDKKVEARGENQQIFFYPIKSDQISTTASMVHQGYILIHRACYVGAR